MAQAVTPPPSPPAQHLALTEYLDALGLRASDLDYLTTPGNTLEGYIEGKMQEAMEIYAGQELRIDFAERVLEAIDQLDKDEYSRYISVPDVPGITHAMLESWADSVVHEHRAAQRMVAVIDASERGAIPRWQPPKPETVSTLAPKGYDDE